MVNAPVPVSYVHVRLSPQEPLVSPVASAESESFTITKHTTASIRMIADTVNNLPGTREQRCPFPPPLTESHNMGGVKCSQLIMKSYNLSCNHNESNIRQRTKTEKKRFVGGCPLRLLSRRRYRQTIDALAGCVYIYLSSRIHGPPAKPRCPIPSSTS